MVTVFVEQLRTSNVNKQFVRDVFSLHQHSKRRLFFVCLTYCIIIIITIVVVTEFIVRRLQ